MSRNDHLQIDADRFAADFDRAPFTIGHSLAGAPELQLDALVELARRLPESSVEWNTGDVPVSLDPARTPRNGLSADETIARIGGCRSWLVLKNVERDPRYRALLDACLDQIERHTDPIDPDMRDREGFIFVSSPRSVTPYHIDIEHNFLLQIRGWKQVSLFDRDDRAVVSEEAIEAYYHGAHRNLPYDPAFQERATVFDLRPGAGLHFPMTAPHWVQNGDEVSVSFSVTFRTRASERRAAAACMNARLRARGLRPAPVGRSPARDAAKALTHRAIARVERWIGAR